jgi:hypothetical protein
LSHLAVAAMLEEAPRVARPHRIESPTHRFQ